MKAKPPKKQGSKNPTPRDRDEKEGKIRQPDRDDIAENGKAGLTRKGRKAGAKQLSRVDEGKGRSSFPELTRGRPVFICLGSSKCEKGRKKREYRNLLSIRLSRLGSIRGGAQEQQQKLGLQDSNISHRNQSLRRFIPNNSNSPHGRH